MKTVLNDTPVPLHDHAAWCRAHTDGGRWDQYCATEPALLEPAAAAACDPMTTYLFLHQPMSRAHHGTAWVVDAPQIVVGIAETLTEAGDRPVFAESVLTPAEARQAAAELLNLADLAEAATGRCAR